MVTSPARVGRALYLPSNPYRARVLEGVAKSQFLRKAVLFKSGDRILMRFLRNSPLEHFGVVGFKVQGAGCSEPSMSIMQE